MVRICTEHVRISFNFSPWVDISFPSLTSFAGKLREEKVIEVRLRECNICELEKKQAAFSVVSIT